MKNNQSAMPMMMSLLRLVLLTSSCLAVVRAKDDKTHQQQLRRLEQHENSHHHHRDAVKVWKREPAREHQHGRRQLLNGGHAFIVSETQGQGVEWCMDGVQGVAPYGYLSYPSLGLRPCAFNTGPSEQLFSMFYDDNGTISSKLDVYDDEICLFVGDGGFTRPKDRIRLAPQCDHVKAQFVFDGDINEFGMIKVATDTSLCVAFEGNNPDDNDNIIVKECTAPNVRWMFRSGWYELGSSGLCVAVKDQLMEPGTRVIFDDCGDAGFAGHWRIDGDGLFHNRLDDGFCMQAVGKDEGDAIRIQPCDPLEDRQRWEWPDGFEAPIYLTSSPTLYLGVQGLTEEAGDNMLLKEDPIEWSGDAVH